MWINTLSFVSFVDRCCEKTLQYMSWLWFHYDRGIVSCMYGWNWICTWRMVAESTLEYPIGLDWVIWRPISTQVTEYPTTSGSWLLRHSERDIDSGIDVGVRHILVLDTFLLLPTCHLEPYDIYYVIRIDADWAVFSLYDLVQRMILRILSRRDGLSAEVHWKHTNTLFPAGPCYYLEWSKWVVVECG